MLCIFWKLLISSFRNGSNTTLYSQTSSLSLSSCCLGSNVHVVHMQMNDINMTLTSSCQQKIQGDMASTLRQILQNNFLLNLNCNLNWENSLKVHKMSTTGNRQYTIHQYSMFHTSSIFIFMFCNFCSLVQFGGKRMRNENQTCASH
jgi:metal-sulfur cluster biosynthetic enzyme